MPNEENLGVSLSNKEIQECHKRKTMMPRATTQIPVFRDAGNLLYYATVIMEKAPRSLRRFVDCVINDADEICKAIALADVNRDDQRCFYIEAAISNAYVVQMHAEIAWRHHVIDKDMKNKMQALVKRIIAQLVAWRDYTQKAGSKHT